MGAAGLANPAWPPKSPRGRIMGMYGSCWRITPAAWAELQELDGRRDTLPPEVVIEEYDRIIAGGLDAIGNPRHLNLEKEWQALHILLTGTYDAPASVKPAANPLGRAVLGGAETAFESTYGVVRVLAADEVRVVAAALAANPLDDLRARFDPTPLAGMRIYTYPPADEWGEDEWDLLRHYYDEMTGFYAEAARGGRVDPPVARLTRGRRSRRDLPDSRFEGRRKSDSTSGRPSRRPGLASSFFRGDGRPGRPVA